MKKLILSFILLLTPFSGVIIAQNEYVPSPENLESRQQFAQDRFGIFIHWGIYSMLANKEWVMQHQGLEFNEYSQIAGGFSPLNSMPKNGLKFSRLPERPRYLD